VIDEQGVWHDNVTCPMCRRRHPAAWSCAKAADIARLSRIEDNRQEALAWLDKKAWLEAFIERAGFTYGWDNLESWAQRMAEQAYEEIVLTRD
jgi:hypothetical protein